MRKIYRSLQHSGLLFLAGQTGIPIAWLRAVPARLGVIGTGDEHPLHICWQQVLAGLDALAPHVFDTIMDLPHLE